MGDNKPNSNIQTVKKPSDNSSKKGGTFKTNKIKKSSSKSDLKKVVTVTKIPSKHTSDNKDKERKRLEREKEKKRLKREKEKERLERENEKKRLEREKKRIKREREKKKKEKEKEIRVSKHTPTPSKPSKLVLEKVSSNTESALDKEMRKRKKLEKIIHKMKYGNVFITPTRDWTSSGEYGVGESTDPSIRNGWKGIQ